MDNGCSAPTKTDNGIMRFGAQDNGIMRFGAQDNGIMRFGAQDNGIMKVPISHAGTLTGIGTPYISTPFYKHGIIALRA